MSLSHFDWTAVEAAVGTLLAVGGVILAVRRKAGPWWRQLVADLVKARDSINGRDEIKDSITGEVLVPAVDGIGVRMNDAEKRQQKTATELAVLVKQTKNLTETVQQLAETQLAQHHLERRVDDHERRIVKLENSQVERIVARAESAQAWSAMEAAIHADPGDVDLDPVDIVDAEADPPASE